MNEESDGVFSQEYLTDYEKRKSEVLEKHSSYEHYLLDVLGRDPMDIVYELPDDFDVEKQSTIGVRGNLALRDRKILTPKRQRELSNRALA